MSEPRPRTEVTRREMLRLGGVGVGGAAAGTLLAAAGGLLDASPAPAASLASPTDTDRLRRLISVELLMLYCYQHVLAGPLLRPRAHRLMLPLRGQEQAHIHVLSSRLAALGGTPPVGPASVKEADRDLARRGVGGRLNQLQGERDALFLLLAVEQVVVGAYFVALTKLNDPHLVVLAAQIMANDAQHEALVGDALHPGEAQEAVPYGLVQGIQ